MNNEQWTNHLDTLQARAETSTNQNFKDAIAGVIETTHSGDNQQDTPRALSGAGIPLSSVAQRPIEWLWEGHLAAGMTHVITGPGGLGKSTYARHIIACVTQGWDMPDGTPCLMPGGVITAFMEEPIAEVVIPRLRDAGADMSLIRDVSKVDQNDAYGGTVKRPFTLKDIEALESARRAVGATLLVIDSMTSALGDVSKYNSQQVYRTFNDLAGWAEHAGVAIMIIAHPPANATPKKPSSFISGSPAIFNNVRMVDLMLPDAQQPGVTMVMNIKNNVHMLMRPLGFHRLPDGRLEFIHGKTPEAEKVQQARRLGDAMSLIKETVDNHAERTFTSQDLAIALENAGISIEFSTVRSYLTRLVEHAEIQAVEGKRNCYASLLYKPTTVHVVPMMTDVQIVKPQLATQPTKALDNGTIADDPGDTGKMPIVTKEMLAARKTTVMAQNGDIHTVKTMVI